MMKIKILIEKSGLKKKYIAKKIGVVDNTMTNWVLGKTTPNIIQAQKLSRILGLKSIDELFNGDK